MARNTGDAEVEKRGYFQLYIAHPNLAADIVDFLEQSGRLLVMPVPVMIEGAEHGEMRMPNDTDEDVCHIVTLTPDAMPR